MADGSRLNLRVPDHVREMILGAAQRHGRTLIDEARVALELHAHRALRIDVRARAPYLLDMFQSDEAFDDFARQVEQDTAALEVIAYRLPAALPLSEQAARN